MYARKMLSLLAAVLAVGLVQVAAHGAVTFGFDVNPSVDGQMFVYSGGGDGVATLTADANVDFTVKFDTNPTVTTYSDADFTFSGSQTDSNAIPGVGSVLYFDGTFSFADANSGDLIVSGAFTRAHVLLIDGSSSAAISASSEEIAINGFMDYTDGPAFEALVDDLGMLPPGQIVNLVPIEDMGFTLTNITPTIGSIDGFTANSSHSANADMEIIPEPGTLALLGVGAVALVYRRRRR